MYQGESTDTLTGTPQGAGAPWRPTYTGHHDPRQVYGIQLPAPHQRRTAWRRKQGKGNYLYVRYADDFVVLCNGTKAEAQSMKEELQHVLHHMGLTLSEEKTKITHITEGFQFLGYRIERSRGEEARWSLRYSYPKGHHPLRHKIREMLAPSTSRVIERQDSRTQQPHRRMVQLLPLYE